AVRMSAPRKSMFDWPPKTPSTPKGPRCLRCLRWPTMLFLVFALGCSSRPPCEEPVEDAPEGIVSIPLRVPENMKLVHYVSFEMGPVQETLTGYMIVRAPDALRLYGM